MRSSKLRNTQAATLLLLLLTTLTTKKIQAQFDIEDSHTTASLRGIHNVGGGVAWASGTNGTVLRTDGTADPVVLASGVPTGGLSFLYFDNVNPPGQIVPGGSPAALNQCQRDSVAKVRITVRANLPNPNPRISTPIASVAQSEVAVRNRSLVNF